jgi:hypothetical protein
MRIIAIDASPINGGPASYAVDVSASAAEDSGAEVIRIRLYDLHAFCCTQCGACTDTGRCTKRDGLLSHAERVMQAADVLVLGAPARLSTPRHGALALCHRLLGAYTGMSVARGWYNSGSTFAEGKRAAVIAAGSVFGLPIGPVGMARAAGKQLAEAGVTLVECGAIPGAFSSPSARDITRERAEALGRRLAKPEASPPSGPRGRRRGSRVTQLTSEPETAR